MELSFNSTFRFLFNPSSFITVLQGSSGSGKTYSVLQMIIIKCVSSEWENKTIDVVRRTFPAHKIGAMKDFEDILKRLGLYNQRMHNKSEHSYLLGSCKIRFYSTDDEAKMRGPRRDVVYFNEVLELKRMDVVQVLMRTNDFVFMDYNPSEEFHWLYEDILEREDVFFHKSTFLDNPLLPENQAKQIRMLKKTDPNLWRIYGLGERGVSEATIFSNWDYYSESFDSFEGLELFGLDFGFNHPSALVRVKICSKTRRILLDELLYKSGLTGAGLVREFERLEKEGLISRTSSVTADNARPELINELCSAGFNVYPTKKGTKSVLDGINFLKQHELLVTEGSVNLAKELRTYKWKVDKDDRVLDEPVKLNDHLLDGGRYACESEMRGGVFVSSIGGRKNEKR